MHGGLAHSQEAPERSSSAPSSDLVRRLPYYALGLLAFYVIHTVSLIGKPEGWLLDAAGRYWLNDFSGVWTAGDVTNRGFPEWAYDVAKLCREQTALRGAPSEGCYPWPYPPHVLPLAAALANLPLVVAMLVWLGLTASCFGAVARLITGSWQGVVLMLAGPATLNILYTGQNGFLSAALVGAALLLLPSRPVLAGVAFGMLAYKPHLGLLIPLALLAAGHWRTVVAAGLTVASVVLASIAFQGLEVWHLFILQLGNVASLMQSHFDTSKLRSIFGLLQTFGLPAGPALAVHTLLAIVVAGLVILAWRSRMASDLKAAVLAAAIPMASPYVFAYDLAILCIAQAFFVRHALARGRFAMTEFGGLAVVNILQPANGGLAGILLIGLILRGAGDHRPAERPGSPLRHLERTALASTDASSARQP
jgi:arabinofuranan 3-O-arabinosyltransferase